MHLCIDLVKAFVIIALNWLDCEQHQLNIMFSSFGGRAAKNVPVCSKKKNTHICLCVLFHNTIFVCRVKGSVKTGWTIWSTFPSLSPQHRSFCSNQTLETCFGLCYRRLGSDSGFWLFYGCFWFVFLFWGWTEIGDWLVKTVFSII